MTKDELAEAHKAWRERMRLKVAEMVRCREECLNVWGVQLGSFEGGQFTVPHAAKQKGNETP